MRASYLTHEVGALGGGSKPFERRRIIEAAGVLARRRAALDEELAGQINIQVIDYILIRSDNPHGRCVDSAAAIAKCVGRSVDRVETVLRTLRAKDILDHQERPGHSGAYWVPYPRALLDWRDDFAPSAHSLIDAISGPGRAGGRPKKVPGNNDRVSETPIPPVADAAGFREQTPGDERRGLEKPPVPTSQTPCDGHCPADTRSRNSDEEELEWKGDELQGISLGTLQSNIQSLIDNLSTIPVQVECSSITEGFPLPRTAVPGSTIISSIEVVLTEAQIALYREWFARKAPGVPLSSRSLAIDPIIADQNLWALIDGTLRRGFGEDVVEEALSEAFTTTQQKIGANQLKGAPTRYFTTVFQDRLNKIPAERMLRKAELGFKLQTIQTVSEARANAEIANADADTKIAERRVEAFVASVEQGKVNRQKIADGKIQPSGNGSGQRGKFVISADGRGRWAEDARVVKLGFVEVLGRHANVVLESHPLAKTGDVIAAFELVEAQGGHRITKGGQIFPNAVLEVVKAATKLLPRIVLHREYGTPDQLCWGDVATADTGQKLCTDWVAISVPFVDSLAEKYPAAAFYEEQVFKGRSEHFEGHCRLAVRKLVCLTFNDLTRNLHCPEKRYGAGLQEEVEREIETRIVECAAKGHRAFEEYAKIAARKSENIAHHESHSDCWQ